MEIMFLWGMIALLLTGFYKVDRRACYLLIPYFLWVTFATVLNQAFWLLNTY
jgi:tryptophan-rich sensory protein